MDHHIGMRRKKTAAAALKSDTGIALKDRSKRNVHAGEPACTAFKGIHGHQPCAEGATA